MTAAGSGFACRRHLAERGAGIRIRRNFLLIMLAVVVALCLLVLGGLALVDQGFGSVDLGK